MSESNLELKDIYDDAILQGTIDGALITRICSARERMDGSTEGMVRFMSSQTADRLAEKMNGDGKVTFAIASILYMSAIIYGETGKAFLKKKAQEAGEDFSQEEYTLAVAEAVFRDQYRGKRKTAVLEGLKAALMDADHIEANAAKVGILINEYRFEKDFSYEYTLQDSFLNGDLIQMHTVQEKMISAKFGEPDETTALENLNIVYDYLKKNPSLYENRYREIFPNVSDEKRLVYFIARLGHTEIERVKDRSANGK